MRGQLDVDVRGLFLLMVYKSQIPSSVRTAIGTTLIFPVVVIGYACGASERCAVGNVALKNANRSKRNWMISKLADAVLFNHLAGKIQIFSATLLDQIDRMSKVRMNLNSALQAVPSSFEMLV
mgnify:CR=1 FL=1